MILPGRLSLMALLTSAISALAQQTTVEVDVIDRIIIAHYKRCWVYKGPVPDGSYQPRMRVYVSMHGTLKNVPYLLVKPNTEIERLLGESALNAVKNCAPLPVTADWLKNYKKWNSLVLRFDPRDLSEKQPAISDTPPEHNVPEQGSPAYSSPSS